MLRCRTFQTLSYVVGWCSDIRQGRGTAENYMYGHIDINTSFVSEIYIFACGWFEYHPVHLPRGYSMFALLFTDFMEYGVFSGFEHHVAY